MKKILLSAFVLFTAINSFAEKLPLQILSQDENGLTIKIVSPDYKIVQTPSGQNKISLKYGYSLLQKGYPDLAKYALPINLPAGKIASAEVISSSYADLTDIEIGPSKGTLSRAINPADVSLTYSEAYENFAFYPASLTNLAKPYFIRTQKGQAMSVTPFQYNAVSKTLRVYNELVIKISFVNDNVTEAPSLEFKDDKEFQAIYADHFINYNPNTSAKVMYTPVNEDGDMLIICEDAFSAKMTPFINWKKLKGIQTTMVLKSQITTGAITSALIKNYITTYMGTNPNLKYVLLVGDDNHIPSSSTPVGVSDNDYAYLAGGDHYPDIFMGRMSAQSATDVEVQVNKAVNYERNPTLGGASFNKGFVVASDQGPGDNNEMDYQHAQIMRGKFLGFTYTNIQEFYDGSQGGTDASGAPTPTMIKNFLNSNGAGVVCYTGHGSNTSWGTSGFSNTDISTLTNTNQLPIIFSVACVNGNFTITTCFAEAWLRAGTPSAPKGAVATVMSTINQYWDEPMAGQDHMVDLLVATPTVSVKRTFAGIAMNGCMHMNDVYPGSGDDMTDTWTVFGDPSLKVTTDQTAPMTVSHPASVNLGTSNIITTCNTNGADICYNVNGNILSTGKVSGTTANLTFPPLTTTDTIYVTGTAFNKTPYFGKIVVNGATGISNVQAASGISIYPNPAANSLNVKVANGSNYSYEIINMIGQIVKSGNKNKSVVTESIDIQNLENGTYFMRLKMDSETKTVRFIKSAN